MLLNEGPSATVALVPLGRVPARDVAAVRRALGKVCDFQIVVAPRRALPRETYYPPRHRYRAEHLRSWLRKGELAYSKVLGVTSVDISTTAHGRKDWGIAGQADLGGRAAVVSSFRAKARLGDIAVHEIGHTLGLPHCPHARCIMRDANGRLERVGLRFCGDCRQRIEMWLR